MVKLVPVTFFKGFIKLSVLATLTGGQPHLLAEKESEPDTPLEIVLHVNNELWNNRNTSVVEEFIAEDVDYTTPYSTTQGRAGILLDATQYYDWAESNISSFKTHAAEGADVFIRWKSESKPRGETAFYNSQGIDYYRVEDGKITVWKTAHEIDSTASNKKLVQKIVAELWNQRDLSAVDRYFAQDVEILYEGSASAGKANIAGAATAYFKGWSDTRTEITHLIAEGDAVTIRWVTTATHTGTYNGIEATGITITYTGADLYRFSEGLVVETWTFWDRAAVTEVLEKNQ